MYGGEMSARHYFRDFAFCDSGMLPWLLIAALVSTSGLSLEGRLHRLPCSGEINFTVVAPRAAIARVLAHYVYLAPALDYTDGLSADFGEWRFNLRNCNTEPLVRLNVKSRGDPGLVAERVVEITEMMEFNR